LFEKINIYDTRTVGIKPEKTIATSNSYFGKTVVWGRLSNRKKPRQNATHNVVIKVVVYRENACCHIIWFDFIPIIWKISLLEKMPTVGSPDLGRATGE